MRMCAGVNLTSLLFCALMRVTVPFVLTKGMHTAAVGSVAQRLPLTAKSTRGSCGICACSAETGYMRRKPMGVGAGELRRLDRIPFGLSMPARDVWVWLPPGYSAAAAAGSRFPVLYCQDGQNMMDSATSWLNADWQLGRIASNLQQEGRMRPTIMVLIANSGSLRRIEYGDNPVGRIYVNWMCDTLKPIIDRDFQTLAQPHETFAMGSSMGGSISFLATVWRPDVFGNACALSPLFEPQTIAGLLSSRARYTQDARFSQQRFYIDNGGSTFEKQVPLFDARDGSQGGYWWLDTQFQPGIDALLLALQAQGLVLASRRLCFMRYAGERHNERAWRRRVFAPLEFMLAPNASTTS